MGRALFFDLNVAGVEIVEGLIKKIGILHFCFYIYFNIN